MNFSEANKVIHPVEKQWHFPILNKWGFIPENKEAIGLVRSYSYNHPDGHKIVANTGANADYWENIKTGGFGYWGTLEEHVAKLISKN